MSGQRMNVGTLFVELLLDDSELGTGTARATKRLSSFADGLRSVAQKIDATLTAALERAALAAAGVVTAAAVVGAGFEKQMSKVAAIAGSTTEELAALTEEARRIGATTQFSATDAAEGMESLASAGFTAGEIVTATADAMALAGANAVELDTATSLVAATLVQFNLTAADAGRVSDVFTAAAQVSLLTVDDLAVAMRYAGTAGAALGYSLEETTAAVAMFRNLGLTGEQAGTNFRAMMESLANPTKKAAETLDVLGIKLEEVNPAMHSFDEVVARLARSGIDLGKSYAVFGSIAGGNVLSLVEDWRAAGAEANGYQKILDELATSHGTAQRSFDAMAANTAGGWERLKSSAEEFLLVLFEMGKGPLNRLLEGLTARLDLMSKVFASGAETGATKLDRLVDGVLALTDVAVALVPRLEAIAVAMFAAIVGAKGVTYSIAIVELAAKFGVNLPAAIMKAVTALRAMTAAQAAFTLTGLGLVLAGLAAFAVAVVKLGDSFSGAARAARELEGTQRGIREFAEATDKERASVTASLEATKAEISARLAMGQAITNQERALLEYTAAQAFAEVEAGKMLAYSDRLVFSTEAGTEAINDFKGALLDQASDASKTAEQLEYLAGQYHEIGGIDFVNDLFAGGQVTNFAGRDFSLMSGQLSKARELTGLSIKTYEDLVAAIARLREEQSGATQRAANLGNQLAIQRADAIAAAKALETAALTAEKKAEADAMAAASAHDLTAEEKAAAKALEERAAALGAFGDWFARWEADASVGDEMLAEVNEEVRGLARNLARVGAAAQQTIPQAVETFKGFSEEIEYASNVLQSFSAKAPKWKKQIEDIGNRLRAMFNDERDAKVDTVWGAIWDSIVAKAKASFEKIKDMPKKLADDVGGFFQNLPSIAFNTALKIGSGFFGLLKKEVELLKIGLTALWNQTLRLGAQTASSLTGLFRPLLDMVSPAAIFAPLAPLFDLKGTFAASRGENMSSNKTDEQVEKYAATRAVTTAADQAVAFVEGLARALPAMLAALVKALPSVIDALIEEIPRVIEALAEAIPDLIAVLVEKLPILVDAVLSALPELIRALGDGVVQIIGMLPDLLTAILSNLPAIITALVNQIPKIIDALVAAAPDIVIAIVEQLPYIIFALIRATPKIMWAMITLVPRLIFAIVKALPEIVEAFWDSFKDVWPRFVEWAGKIAKMIGNGLMEVVTLGLFKSEKEKEKGGGSGFLGGLFDKKTERAASGIDYVPHTMATVLEPGEAVLDALANQARIRRELNEPGPIPGGGGGGAALALAIQFDTRTMDEVLVSGLSSGRAPNLKRTLRTTSGRRPGFSRGRFQPFAG